MTIDYLIPPVEGRRFFFPYIYGKRHLVAACMGQTWNGKPVTWRGRYVHLLVGCAELLLAPILNYIVAFLEWRVMRPLFERELKVYMEATCGKFVDQEERVLSPQQQAQLLDFYSQFNQMAQQANGPQGGLNEMDLAFQQQLLWENAQNRRQH